MSADTANLPSLPPPGPGEVTVQVECAGLSHIDGFIRADRETDGDDPWPRRSGSEFAGIVVAVGGDTGGFRVGTNMVSSFRTLKARDMHEAAG